MRRSQSLGAPLWALALCLVSLYTVTVASDAISDDDVLEVFIIPHTHDDVGWLLSVDQYYVRQVQWILDSCIRQLLDNPERKFTYVEMAYFQRWWDRLPESGRQQVRTLYQRGQLEFNLGGIAMNDEGVTTYFEEINQMTHGAAFLQKELGAHSRSAWHIDPFGHSAATASLWSDVGFDGFVLNRIPQDLKSVWKDQKHLEFIWRPSKRKIGAITTTDTIGWNGIYIQDDPRIFDENVDEIVNDFVNMAKSRAQFYRHKKLLIPFGDDFAHREAFTSFVQMDKLIKYVNQNTAKTGVKARYAFLSEYVAAVNALNLTWPVYEGDFFPYADGTSNGSYWSGYFTSRIALKGYVRSSDSLLHAGELLFTLFKDTVLGTDDARRRANSQLEVLRQAAFVSTHHDAVTGTEKAAVAADYTTRLDMGNQAVKSLITTIYKGIDSQTFTTAATRTAVKLFNPLGWTRKEVVRIPINSTSVKVMDAAGNLVPSQINPVPSYSIDKQSASYNLFFTVQLRPLEVQTLYIQQSQLAEEGKAVLGTARQLASSIENEYLRVDLNPTTNRINAVTNKKLGVKSKLEQDFLQYIPADSEEIQSSGAYIFQPTSNTGFAAGSSNNNLLSVTRHFPREYATVPQVLATPRGQDYNDTFAVSVRSVSTKAVTFNVWRVDGNNNNGWGQTLQIDYLALEGAKASTSLPINGSQYGTIVVGPWHKPVITTAIKFTMPFRGTPLVFATALSQDVDDTYTISVQSVTSDYAIVNVQRVNGDGWDQNLQLTWLAFVPDNSESDPSLSSVHQTYPRYIAGRTNVAPSPSSPIVTLTINHPEFWQWPLILVSVKTPTNNTWGTTIRPIQNQNSFILNLYIASGNGWKENVEVDWVIIQRDDLVETVIPPQQSINTTVYNGPIVQEIQQFLQSGYAQTVRLYQGTSDELAGNFLEIEEEIGPINQGTEFVTRFSTDLDNRQTCFTDDNSLLIQKRVFNATKHDPVPANYFPMVARAFIQDTRRNVQFTLISDRSHGAASLNAGQLEVMLDRRCISDDGRGVGEVLDDKNRTQQVFMALFDQIDNSALLHRKLAIRQQFPLQITTYESSGSVGPAKPRSGLNYELPYNVHLLSLYTQDFFNFSQFSSPPSASAPSTTSQVLVRLQHIFEEGESIKYSTPVSIDLGSLFTFSGWRLANITEVNLTANRAKANIQKLKWLTTDKTSAQDQLIQGRPLLESDPRASTVTLYPSEIRSFLFALSPS